MKIEGEKLAILGTSAQQRLKSSPAQLKKREGRVPPLGHPLIKNAKDRQKVILRAEEEMRKLLGDKFGAPPEVGPTPPPPTTSPVPDHVIPASATDAEAEKIFTDALAAAGARPDGPTAAMVGFGYESRGRVAGSAGQIVPGSDRFKNAVNKLIAASGIEDIENVVLGANFRGPDAVGVRKFGKTTGDDMDQLGIALREYLRSVGMPEDRIQTASMRRAVRTCPNSSCNSLAMAYRSFSWPAMMEPESRRS